MSENNLDRVWLTQAPDISPGRSLDAFMISMRFNESVDSGVPGYVLHEHVFPRGREDDTPQYHLAVGHFTVEDLKMLNGAICAQLAQLGAI